MCPASIVLVRYDVAPLGAIDSRPCCIKVMIDCSAYVLFVKVFVDVNLILESWAASSI